MVRVFSPVLFRNIEGDDYIDSVIRFCDTALDLQFYRRPSNILNLEVNLNNISDNLRTYIVRRVKMHWKAPQLTYHHVQFTPELDEKINGNSSGLEFDIPGKYGALKRT